MPDATLTIAGYGSEEPRLRRLVGDCRLADVRFVGKVDPAAMPRLYDEADIYLNASVVDNQPVSILEAFAAGLPVISTPPATSPRWSATSRPDCWCRRSIRTRLHSAVIGMLAQPNGAIAFAKRAHETIGRYTWPAVRDAWADVYQRRGRTALSIHGQRRAH